MNEIGDLQFMMGLHLQDNERQEEEPVPLFVDSLLPISADIDP